eukprot:gene15969-18987_t
MITVMAIVRSLVFTFAIKNNFGTYAIGDAIAFVIEIGQMTAVMMAVSGGKFLPYVRFQRAFVPVDKETTIKGIDALSANIINTAVSDQAVHLLPKQQREDQQGQINHRHHRHLEIHKSRFHNCNSQPTSQSGRFDRSAYTSMKMDSFFHLFCRLSEGDKTETFRLNWGKQKEHFIAKDTKDAKTISEDTQVIEQPTLVHFVKLIGSSSPPNDIALGLRSLIKIIRTEKETQTVATPNYRNDTLALLFKFLRQSPNAVELFAIWDLYIDKPDIYNAAFTLLLDFFAIILTINDDPALLKVSSRIISNITENRMDALTEVIKDYSADRRVLAINTYRLCAAMASQNVQIAKLVYYKFPFASKGYEETVTTISTLGPYNGTRAFALRFMLAFLKHKNAGLTKTVMADQRLFKRFTAQMAYDHYNVALDLVEGLHRDVVMPADIVSKKTKVAFFTGDMLGKLATFFAKEDIPDDVRDQFHALLTPLCTSPTLGIAPRDTQWHWLRSSATEPTHESSLIHNVAVRLEPAKYPQHRSLLVEIINACPDLFLKASHPHPGANLGWLSHTATAVRVILSSIPRAPSSAIRMVGDLSPLTLADMLVPSLRAFNLGDEHGPFVLYTQTLIYVAYLRRINIVLADLTACTTLPLGDFIAGLKSAVKERLLPLSHLIGKINSFIASPSIYLSLLTLLAEYTRFLFSADLISPRFFDARLLTAADTRTQRSLIQIFTLSKTLHQPANLLERADPLLSMLLSLYTGATQLRDAHHQLLVRLLTASNLFAGCDSEIDHWLENIDAQTAPFLVRVLTDTLANKFRYIDLVQRINTRLISSPLTAVSPLLVAALSAHMAAPSAPVALLISRVLASISIGQNERSTVVALIHILWQSAATPDTPLASLLEADLLAKPDGFEVPSLATIYRHLTRVAGKSLAQTTLNPTTLIDNIDRPLWRVAHSFSLVALAQSVPIGQLLGHLVATDAKDRAAYFGDFDAHLYFVATIEALPARRLATLLPTIATLADLCRDSAHLGALLDIAGEAVTTLLATNAAPAIKACNDFINIPSIQALLLGDNIDASISILRILSDALSRPQARHIAASSITRILTSFQLECGVLSSPANQAISFLLPRLDMPSCLAVVNALLASADPSPKQLNLALHSLARFASFNTNASLMSTIRQLGAPINGIIDQLVSPATLANAHATTSEETRSTMTSIFSKLVSLSIDIDAAILHLLLATLAQPSIYGYATFVPAIMTLLPKYLAKSTLTRSATLAVVTAHSSPSQRLEILNSSSFLAFTKSNEPTIWMPIIAKLIEDGSSLHQDIIKHIIGRIDRSLVSSATPLFTRMLSGAQVDLSLAQTDLRVVLLPIATAPDQSTPKPSTTAYFTSLQSALEANDVAMISTLSDDRLINFYMALEKSTNKNRAVIKEVCSTAISVMSGESILLVDRIFAIYKSDNMPRTLLGLLADNPRVHTALIARDTLAYHLAHLLHAILRSDPKLAQNAPASRTSAILTAYQATMHPVDKLLYRMLYLHETNGSPVDISTWGTNHSTGLTVNALMISGMLLNDEILKLSLRSFPEQAKLDMTDVPVLDSSSVDGTEYPYDPAFLLRLFKSMLANDENLHRSAFYNNGPLAYTVCAMSSHEPQIRKLAKSILKKFVVLLEKSTTVQTVQNQHKVLSVFTNALKDGIVPPLCTMFIINAISIFSKDDHTTRFEVIEYFNAHHQLDLNLQSFQQDKNKLSEFMLFFDAQLSSGDGIKDTIIGILSSVASISHGAQLLAQHGAIPWITTLLSNWSLPKSLFESTLSLLQSILSHLPKNAIELNQAPFIIDFILNYILRIEWTREFMGIVENSMQFTNTNNKSKKKRSNSNNSTNTERMTTITLINIMVMICTSMTSLKNNQPYIKVMNTLPHPENNHSGITDLSQYNNTFDILVNTLTK